jgi:GAF domain-containing protein
MWKVLYKELKFGWRAAEAPPNEVERLAALEELHILDTEPSEKFDRITELLSKQFNTAFALVSLVDKDRQWFKSACGIDAKETPRNQAFCAHAIWNSNPLIVLDATKDERFQKNPLVDGPPHIRFYAGAPLKSKESYHLGTLCAIDTKPRKQVTENEITLLTSLAAMVVDELELHLASQLLEERKS